MFEGVGGGPRILEPRDVDESTVVPGAGAPRVADAGFDGSAPAGCGWKERSYESVLHLTSMVEEADADCSVCLHRAKEEEEVNEDMSSQVRFILKATRDIMEGRRFTSTENGSVRIIDAR